MRPITDEKVIVEFGVWRAIVRRKTSILLADVEDFALVRGIAVIAVRVAVAVCGRVWCGVGAGIVSLDVAGHENFAVAQGGGGCTRTGNPGNGKDKRIFFKNVSQPTRICIFLFQSTYPSFLFKLDLRIKISIFNFNFATEYCFK